MQVPQKASEVAQERKKSFEIHIGHDLLQLLSSSMYLEPMTIYREYVQNAMDALDEARQRGLIDADVASIVFDVDAASRTSRIRDNGIGIPNDEVVQRLLAIGASRKRRLALRGFRGIGRLAGLGYCQRLTFRTRSHGDESVAEISWDCRELKRVLQDSSELDLAETVRSLVTVQMLSSVSAFPERFFEVELTGILRVGGDKLLNVQAIRDYLSQIAPVPFLTEFSFASKIEEHFSRFSEFQSVAILLNGVALNKPYSDSLPLGRDKETTGRELVLFTVPALDDGIAAIGWLVHHDYLGSFPTDSLVAGLRGRVGNLQIGNAALLDAAFSEPRFNQWSVGEIHVVDRRLIPNGRRDNFEQNAHYANLINHLSPLAKDIAKRCRHQSRSRQGRKRFELLLSRMVSQLELLKRLKGRSRGLMVSNIKRCLGEMERLAAEFSLDDGKLDELEALRRKVCRFKHDPSARKRPIVLSEARAADFVSLLYETIPDGSKAALIVETLLT